MVPAVMLIGLGRMPLLMLRVLAEMIVPPAQFIVPVPSPKVAVALTWIAPSLTVVLPE